MKTSNILLITFFGIILLSVTVFIGFLHTQININCIEGNGTTVQKEINLPSFRQIEVESHISVILTQSSSQKIEVEAAENIQKYLKITVENKILRIGISNCIKDKAPFVIKISVDSLQKINISDGSIFKTIGTFKGDSLIIEASSGCEIDANFIYKFVHCDASSGGNVVLKGEVTQTDIEVNSGGQCNAIEMKSNTCKISANSGGHGTVNVSSELNADANSGGSIQYKGNPSSKQINSNSGGSVSNIN